MATYEHDPKFLRATFWQISVRPYLPLAMVAVAAIAFGLLAVRLAAFLGGFATGVGVTVLLFLWSSFSSAWKALNASWSARGPISLSVSAEALHFSFAGGESRIERRDGVRLRLMPWCALVYLRGSRTPTIIPLDALSVEERAQLAAWSGESRR